MLLFNWGAVKKWVERAVKVFRIGRKEGLWKEKDKPRF
jgi:hypothetical protein